MRSVKRKSRPVLVLLYDARVCRSNDLTRPHTLADEFWSLVCDLVCGFGRPNHAVAVYDGWYYLCTRVTGCVRFPAAEKPLIAPNRSYRVWTTNPDTGPWDRREKFTLCASILSGLGLLPPHMRCMNCVQAMAQLVGIHTPRLRTVASLEREIEKVL